jgi:hypothetical protein
VYHVPFLDVTFPELESDAPFHLLGLTETGSDVEAPKCPKWLIPLSVAKKFSHHCVNPVARSPALPVVAAKSNFLASGDKTNRGQMAD